MAENWVYRFGGGVSDGRGLSKELLGGKGANVAEMTRVLGPDLIPAGFTITTAACVAFMRDGRTAPDGLADAVDEAIARLEQHAGRRFGDAEPAATTLARLAQGADDPARPRRPEMTALEDRVQGRPSVGHGGRPSVNHDWRRIGDSNP